MGRRTTVGRDAGVCHSDDVAGRPRPAFGRPGGGEGERRASSRWRKAAPGLTNARLGRSQVTVGGTGGDAVGKVSSRAQRLTTWCPFAATLPGWRATPAPSMPSRCVAVLAYEHAQATDVVLVLS